MKRSFRAFFICALLLLAPLFVACSATTPTTTSAPQDRSVSQSPTAVPAPTLTDITSPDDLKVRFNQDAGIPRIILLVSPT